MGTISIHSPLRGGQSNARDAAVVAAVAAAGVGALTAEVACWPRGLAAIMEQAVRAFLAVLTSAVVLSADTNDYATSDG